MPSASEPTTSDGPCVPGLETDIGTDIGDSLSAQPERPQEMCASRAGGNPGEHCGVEDNSAVDDSDGVTWRVAYVVSQELAKTASLLPSNGGRSMAVHALISVLGLLKPSPVRRSVLEAEDGDMSASPRRLKRKRSDSPELSPSPHNRCEGVSRALTLCRPTPATIRELQAYHGRAYLDFVLDPKNSIDNERREHMGERWEEDAKEFGIEEDNPPFPNMHTYIRLVAGATLAGVRALREDKADIAVAWDGGRHHAQKNAASGFCYVADCVLAILALKRPLTPPANGVSIPRRKQRVMYLDLDLHFSDGVSQAFYDTRAGPKDVLTLSIHHTSPAFFPYSPIATLPPSIDDESVDPYTLSIPLAPGASGQTFARIWPLVERAREIFNPDVIVLQCGVDGLSGDRLGVWNWGLGGRDGERDDGSLVEGSLGWCVDRVVNHWPGKKLLLGGGGYNTPNAARAWAYLTSIALNRHLPLHTSIPPHALFPIYEPSFILDVPPGNMQDKNTEQSLCELEQKWDALMGLLLQRTTILT